MMKKGRPTPHRGRTVTADEALIWEHATRALAPVKAKPRVASSRGAHTHAAHAHATDKQQKIAPAVAPLPGPAPLPEFDRRQMRAVASGRVEIGARLDLHGCRERDARARLCAFLFAAHAKGHTTVLVITGKGESEPHDALAELEGRQRRGVLRRSVPLWLAEPDLRAVVVSFAAAASRHGGAGALYVRLRKGS